MDRTRRLGFIGVLVVVAIAGTRLSNPYFGIFEGGDWTFPWSKDSAYRFFISSLNPLNNAAVVSGVYSVDNSGWFILLSRFALSCLGMSLAAVQRIEIWSLVVISMASFRYFGSRFLRSTEAKWFGMLAYGFSPLTFNFGVMGWSSLLLAYAVTPLLLGIALELGAKISQTPRLFIFAFGLTSGVLLSGSAAFPCIALVLGCVIWASTSGQPSKDRFSLVVRRTLPRIFMVPLGYLVANAFWLIPRILYNPFDGNDALRELSSSGTSIGANQLVGVNTLLFSERSQFNNSFLSSFPHELRFFLVLLPLLALLSLATEQNEVRSEKKLATFLCAASCVLMFTPILRWLGPLSLVFGRDLSRFYSFFLLGVVSLAAILLDGRTEFSGDDHPSHLRQSLKTFSSISLAIVLGLPFWTGKFEAPQLPDQPSLTLRATRPPADFSRFSSALERRVPEGSRSIVTIPGAPFVRLKEGASRFEPPYNMAVNFGQQLPYPSTWFLSDKVSTRLYKYIAARGAVLTSGDPAEIAHIMKKEGAGVLMFDLRAMSDGDQITLDAVSKSGLFKQWRPSWATESESFERFQVFLFRDEPPDFAAGLTRISTISGIDVGHRISKSRNGYFLGSKRDPIGSDIEVCWDMTGKSQDLLMSTALTYSPHWRVDVEEHNCVTDVTSKSVLTTELRQSADGFLEILTKVPKTSSGLRVQIVFAPARLQEQLILATLLAVFIVLSFLIGTFALRYLPFAAAQGSRRNSKTVD